MEVMVTLAIMAVLVAVSGWGFGLVTGKAVDDCADRMMAVINSDRTTAMGKIAAHLEIFQDTDGVWVKEYVTQGVDGSYVTVTGPVRLGKSDLRVQYVYQRGGSEVIENLGGESSALRLQFDRSTGAFRPMSEMDAVAGANGNYCVRIMISRGSKTKTLKLSYLTGKVTME